jgi:hypothetical protein
MHPLVVKLEPLQQGLVQEQILRGQQQLVLQQLALQEQQLALQGLLHQIHR